DEHTADRELFITGPAGIAVDSLNLFSRADLVLLLSTIGIILLLLILIYRSPFLAFIPLLAAVFVYGVVNQILGLLGKAGVPLSNQSLSIIDRKSTRLNSSHVSISYVFFCLIKK